MSETTVTYAEVLAAARRGRARIAPEMAGYLALGVADALLRHPHAVDERSCWLTDEGAILTTPSATASTGPVELSAAVRRMLGAFLEVARGGGAAATLATVARKTPTADMGALVAEIEAALIPVNRGAARRALARLARETARAREEGVLSLDPPTSQPPARPVEETPAPAPAVVSEPPPPVTALAQEPVSAPPPASSRPPTAVTTPPAAPATAESVPPTATGVSSPSEPPKPLTRADELLARFSGSVVQSDQEIARELKAMVGLEPTPPPPETLVRTDEPPAVERNEPPHEEPSESPPSVDLPLELEPRRRSKATLLVVMGFVVLGVGALAAFLYYPELFSGH